MFSGVLVKLVNAVAPRGPIEFALKSLLLVATFTAFDALVDAKTAVFQSESWVNAASVTFAIGTPFAVFVMAVMSMQRGLQDKLAHLAATDFLTGLPNRRTFLSDVGRQNKDAGVVLLIDADHFKAVNDRFGHDVGDACLRALGDHLRSSLRQGDVVGRIGGEEFAVYLRDPTRKEAQTVAERICAGIYLDRDVGTNEPVSLTVSVGAAEFRPGRPLEAVMRDADDALYRAKSNGRARIEWAQAIESTCRAARDQRIGNTA